MKLNGRLSDIYDFQYGKGNENPDNGGMYPVYGSNGIIGGYDKFNSEDSPVIGHIGANAGSVVFAKGKHFVTYNGVICKIKDCADKMYGYYALLTSNLKKIAFGSAQPFVSYNSLNRILIYLPNIEKQKRIADILSAYDELIENNNKRIKILEQMAENLYKEWFVRFRFPGHEKVALKKQTPSGWVISSNQTDMRCPKNWSYDKFANLGSFIRGKNITAAEMIDGDIPVVSAGIEPSGYHNKQNITGNSLTISASGANAGYLKYNLTDIWAADCSYFQDDKKLWFVYNALKFLQPVISNLQVGAAQPHVYPKNINKLCTIIPDDETIEMYCDKVDTIYEQIKVLNKNNDNLIKQRDMLLPRLMSGKLEVREKQEKVLEFKPKKTFVEFKNEFKAAARKEGGLTEQDLEDLYKAYCDDSLDE
ncbi:MAG: restriction endonuclease subunit S [Clostridia bacterium]|nr:restriction endonuclease subunit S [Clostridia bacterium]